MYEKDHFAQYGKQDSRRSVQPPHRPPASHTPVFQQPASRMSIKSIQGESLTKRLLLKEKRKRMVRGYKDIIWEQRTMDDFSVIDFDPFNFMDDE